MIDSNVFISGKPNPPIPLDRYLPPVPAGVAANWLTANLPKGSWVLDPFGASPQVVVEAARAGYRVAVAANNPIARFLFEMRAHPVSSDELTAALAELGAARRGEERLEPAILELYMTECPNCQVQTPADAFVWNDESITPIAKIINCKSCGQIGEYPSDATDRERAASFQRGGPHMSRALERIAPKGDPDRLHAEEALDAYLPRAVYALFAIINRLDGLTVSGEQRRLISALVLSACDRATKLWAHPSGRMRPKQLSAPAQFREYNIWHELERSVELWAHSDSPVPLVAWPAAPPASGGISLFEGRLRDLPNDAKVKFRAAFAVFPRPNQAYWTLCALWAGWLWGRDAIGPFALVLRRRRYDWAWHSEALHAGLAALSDHVENDTSLFGIISESETGFNSAAIVAANLAGFRLGAIAFRRDSGHLQLSWKKGIPGNNDNLNAVDLVRSASQNLLEMRGEPSPFIELHASSLARLAKLPQLGSQQNAPGELHSELKSVLDIGLTIRGGFLRLGGSEQSLETGLWWLTNTAKARSPLADRVEIAIVRSLLRYPDQGADEIDSRLCKIFPGLLTPPKELIETVLRSYGEQTGGGWKLALSDLPRARRADLREIRAALHDIGTLLGHKVIGDFPIQWQEPDGRTLLNFYVIASAVLGEILLKSQTPPAHSVVVIPGRRVPLALYKIERDPRFKQATEAGWRFLKFRHVRRLAENHALTRDSFAELLDLDPLTLENPQAPLL